MKTEVEITSVTNSSPARDPNVYYVQSPSRDSQEGEKTSNSFQSSPVISPMGSPPHSSRDSSSTRLSSHRVSSKNRRHKAGHEGGSRGRTCKEFGPIEEEGLLGDNFVENVGPKGYFCLTFVVGFLVLFAFFCLVLWAASKPQKPKIIMRSILFDQFMVHAGTDSSGVATKMVSMNSTVKFTFRNTASFFGLHVTSTPLDLSYFHLTIATGSIEKFYQMRKSRRLIVVTVQGNKVPIYGAGADLSSLNQEPVEPVQFQLSFVVRSRGYVLGKLVKVKFHKKIICYVTMEHKKMSLIISLKDKCIYQ